jgi:phage shock protein E
MLEALKTLFGLGPKVDYKQLLNEGAVIVDVRTPGEFAGGNIKGSVNIPLDALASSLSKIPNRDKVVITCCASGMRSASGKSILKSQGYTAHNGGGYTSLQRKIM